MKKATISYLKNHLSQLVQCVREGEAVTVMDRNRPVAVLQPIVEPSGADSDWILNLVRLGAAAMPAESLDPVRFNRLPKPSWKKGRSMAEWVEEDREDRV